jgi:hypothetical protein
MELEDCPLDFAKVNNPVLFLCKRSLPGEDMGPLAISCCHEDKHQ